METQKTKQNKRRGAWEGIMRPSSGRHLIRTIDKEDSQKLIQLTISIM